MNKTSIIYALKELFDNKNFIKIGTTKNLSARKSLMTSGNPRPMLLVHSIPGGKKIEHKIQEKLEDYRIYGEWFYISEKMAINILDAIDKNEEYKIDLILENNLLPPISITGNELSAIHNSSNNIHVQQLLFTIFVLSKLQLDIFYQCKYNKYMVNGNFTYFCRKCGKHSNSDLKVIFELNLVEEIYRGTYQLNFIDYNAEDRSDVAIVVNKFNNIGEFFLSKCENCGKLYKIKKYGQNRLCDDCYEKKRRMDCRLAKRRERNK